MKQNTPRTIFLGITTVLFVAMTLAATIFLREFVRDVIVLHMLSALEFISRLVRSIDSEFLWGLFVLITYVLVLMSLPPLARPKLFDKKEEILTREGRLSFWQHEFENIAQNPQLTKLSVLELKKLVLNTVAFREQCSLRQAELWIKDESNKAPQDGR